jgi:hypothetical protein
MTKRSTSPKTKTQLAAITHKGALTMSSLLHQFPRHLFQSATRKGRKSVDPADTFRMGWEYVPSVLGYEINIEEVTYATAEGAVTLAALVDYIQSSSDAKVTINIDRQSKRWVNALQLDQLTKGWLPNFAAPHANLAGACYVYPLWRWSITDYATCHRIARQIGAQVSGLLESLGYSEIHDLADSTMWIAYEALLNVYEHAYMEGQDPRAFGAITLTPVPAKDDENALAYATAEERRWFDEYRGKGLMLEIAIADYGKGVPASLWNSFFRLKAPRFKPGKGKSLAAVVKSQDRAALHHEVCLWAFDHQSTRKSEGDFLDDYARQNWRGLHRALNTAARFYQCLVLRSGVARTGYAFFRNGASHLTRREVSMQREFPGTGIVIRIPILRGRNYDINYRGADEVRKEELPIEVTDVLSINEAQKKLERQHAGKVTFVGLAHPFKTYQYDDVRYLRDVATRIPPRFIAIHAFARLESPMLLEHLHAFDDNAEVNRVGLPRLFGYWTPGSQFLRWKFMGKMPAYTNSIITELEKNGIAPISVENKPMRNFANNLASVYAPYIAIEDGYLRLMLFEGRLASEGAVIDRMIDKVFNQWKEQTKEAWEYDHATNGLYVRMGAGRLVERYVSILKMLYQENIFTRVLGWRFISLFREFKARVKNPCVVTDSLASYFIINKLLEAESEHIPIFENEAPTVGGKKYDVLIFTDVIHKAENLKECLSKNRGCKYIVSCVDIREKGEALSPDSSVKVVSLINYRFDPGEKVEEAVTELTRVLEVDAVTHIPMKNPSPESLRLGMSAERNEFIVAHPDLFRYGLSHSGGRIHIATLKSNKLVDSHKGLVLEWLKETIAAELDAYKSRAGGFDADAQAKGRQNIVFFTRNESNIKDLVEELSVRLREEQTGWNFFSVALPFVPFGPREVFGRLEPDLDLLEGLKLAGSTGLPFRDDIKRFVAVYLDDACVTGKSLLNFINRVSTASHSQRPSAVIAIPLLSRFSPAEEHFFTSICKEIHMAFDPDARILFSFRPLFRLQVRSFERLQSTPVYQVIAEMSQSKGHLLPRLQNDYLNKVMERYRNEVSNVEQDSISAEVYSHPFYLGAGPRTEIVSSIVLEIRHLIALLEQNVGVLSELLNKVLSACESRDYGLLVMLALEPSLLETSPLRSECRSKISDLAMSALLSGETSDGIKSDALCVLAFQGRPLLNNLPQILRVVWLNNDLVNQLLTFLLTRANHDRTWFATVLEAVDSNESYISVEVRHFIRTCVMFSEESLQPATVVDEPSARWAISQLVAKTSYHAEGLTSMNDVTNWLEGGTYERRFKAQNVRDLLREAIKFIRASLLPGLEGLYWWAGSKLNQRAVNDLSKALISVKANLYHLEQHTEDLGTGALDARTVQLIKKIWNSIRKYSLKRGPDKFLSRPQDPESPVIEEWMPGFFCLPFESILDLCDVRKIVPKDVSMNSNTSSSVVVVPVAEKHVRRIFDLLLSDMIAHGEPDSFEFHFEVDDVVKQLNVVFSNRVRQTDEQGGGMSQEQVRAIAEQPDVDILIQFVAPRRGQVYKVIITFIDVMHIQWG